MIVITVARKPLSEPNVASNTLKHGAGAMNIDATRVKFQDPADEQETKVKNQIPAPMKNQVYGGWHKERPAYDPPGRWPANLVLSHLDGCQQRGSHRVRPGNGSGRAGPGGHGFQSAYVGGEQKNVGTEKIAAWDCLRGCPVAELDSQGEAQGFGVVSRFFFQAGGHRG